MRHHKGEHKDQVITSLKKAHSHIAKIIDMIENDSYCIEVIQQLNAVSGYIDSARRKKLTDHLNSCFSEGMSSADERRKHELIEELVQVLKMSE